MSDVDLRTMITTDVQVLLGALCAGRDPWWDLDLIDETPEERTERHAVAIRVCQRCPVIEPCRAWGEKAPRARYGVWGGRLHIERVNTKPRRRPERPLPTAPDRPRMNGPPAPHRPPETISGPLSTVHVGRDPLATGRNDPMPAPTPDDPDYEHGNIRTADDIPRVARELDGPRDIVPRRVTKPERGGPWNRTAAAAGRSGHTLTEHTTMLDVDGVPNGIITREMPAGELGRPPGYPTIREELTARYADPRAELGDEYDPDLDGPIPA